MYRVGVGAYAKRAMDTWYDTALVTRAGEDILASYDDWAVQFLRQTKLVWSGWDTTTLTPEMIPLPEQPLHGIRQVSVSDPAKFRLFFLSLLWRAAASKLEGFEAIALEDSLFQKLGQMVQTGDTGPDWFCPITLVQHSTRGEVHCLSPILMDKNYGGIDGAPDHIVPCYRFYFDGLVAHIHAQFEPDGGFAAKLGHLIVGHGEVLTVVMLPYEDSFEQRYFNNLRDKTIFAPPGHRR